MAEYTPLISIVMASYNHEAYLEETLRSIWAQAYRNLEIVVYDDCSRDNSWEILMDLHSRSPLPMHIYRNCENEGPAQTFNSALAKSSGDLVALVASDDLFASRRFEGSLKLFSENPDLLAVYANGRRMEEGVEGELVHQERAINLLSNSPKEICDQLYVNSSPLFLQTALFKSSIIKRVGGFDCSLLADDWLLNTRLFSSFTSPSQYAYLEEVVVYYRLHRTNVHKNSKRQERLKIQFIERVTPKELKPEGFSNVYYWVAQIRLSQKRYFTALMYYLRSQACLYRKERSGFIRLLLKKFSKSGG